MERQRLLRRLRELLRSRRLSRSSQDHSLRWARAFLDFHPDRDPSELGPDQIRAYLEHLRRERRCEDVTLARVSRALELLREAALPGGFRDAPGGRPATLGPHRPLPDRREVVRLLSGLHGVPGLVAHLIYATGMRLPECLSLRVSDVDLETLRVSVRSSTGEVDRILPLPRGLSRDLEAQILRVRAIHRRDLDSGHGHARLANASAAVRAGLARTLAWQYLFPADHRARDPHTGRGVRDHIALAQIEQAIAEAAVRAGLPGPVDSRALRRCFAARMLEDGHDRDTVRRLLGGEDTQQPEHYRQGESGRNRDDGVEEAAVASRYGPPCPAPTALGG